MRWLPQRFNDTLGLVVVLGVPVLWVGTALQPEVLGASIAAWALVLNFYFRKADPKP